MRKPGPGGPDAARKGMQRLLFVADAAVADVDELPRSSS
jgi:hypothetical protein